MFLVSTLQNDTQHPPGNLTQGLTHVGQGNVDQATLSGTGQDTHESGRIQTTQCPTCERQCYRVIWIRSAAEVASAYAWPLVLIVVFVCLRSQLVFLLTELGDKIKKASGGTLGTPSWSLTWVDRTTGDASAGPEPDVDKTVAETEDKILATLQKYQSGYGSGATRWSFGLTPGHPELVTFTKAASRLMRRGVIALNPQSQQYYLTDTGIAECVARKNELEKKATYIFPS